MHRAANGLDQTEQADECIEGVFACFCFAKATFDFGS
jgi:hypothetical protein